MERRKSDEVIYMKLISCHVKNDSVTEILTSILDLCSTPWSSMFERCSPPWSSMFERCSSPWSSILERWSTPRPSMFDRWSPPWSSMRERVHSSTFDLTSTPRTPTLSHTVRHLGRQCLSAGRHLGRLEECQKTDSKLF